MVIYTSYSTLPQNCKPHWSFY